MSSRLASLIRRHGIGSKIVEAAVADAPVRTPIKRTGKVAVVFPENRRKTALTGDGWSGSAANWMRSR